jgi:hypothetical protein
VAAQHRLPVKVDSRGIVADVADEAAVEMTATIETIARAIETLVVT